MLFSAAARGVQRIVAVVLLFLASISVADRHGFRDPACEFRSFARRSCGRACRNLFETLRDRCHSTDAQCLRAMAFVLGVTDRSRPLDRISKFQLTLSGRSAR